MTCDDFLARTPDAVFSRMTRGERAQMGRHMLTCAACRGLLLARPTDDIPEATWRDGERIVAEDVRDPEFLDAVTGRAP